MFPRRRLIVGLPAFAFGGFLPAPSLVAVPDMPPLDTVDATVTIVYAEHDGTPSFAVFTADASMLCGKVPDRLRTAIHVPDPRDRIRELAPGLLSAAAALVRMEGHRWERDSHIVRVGWREGTKPGATEAGGMRYFGFGYWGTDVGEIRVAVPRHRATT